MARKDVQLVIRARDEAKGVLKEITKAVEAFTASSKDMVAGTKGADSALGKMGAAIGDLKKAVAGLDFEKKLANEVGRASERLTAMNQNLEEAVADIDRLEKQVDEGRAALVEFRSEVEKSSASLEEAKTKANGTKNSLRELTTEYSKNETLIRRSNAAFETQSKKLAEQTARLEDAQKRFAELGAEIAQVEKPNKRLTDSFAAAERRVESYSESISKTEMKMANTKARIAELVEQNAKLNVRVKETSQSFTEQSVAVQKATNVLKGQKAAASEAAKAQKEIDAALESSVQSALKMEAAIKRDEAAFAELEQAVVGARAKLETLQAVSLGNLTKEITAQRTAAVLAEEEFRQLTATVERLQAATGGVPTREMARDLRFAEQAASEAGLKFMLQSETLDQMNRVMRQSGTDAVSLANKTDMLAAAQAKLNAGMEELAGDGLKARNAIRELERGYDAAAQAAREKAAMSQRVSSAHQRELTLTQQLAAAYRGLYNGQRQSLSLMQRIRGEALSLAAAYGGLFAAINVLQGAAEATQKLEAATARLNVANSGDLKRTGADLDFVRRNADRLGIEFGVLATEYSKFSIATKGTNLEGENTRNIFKSVAEAARVNRSSTAEMAGVFTALTQIVSKGAVQMEELRQQLGDRLPGALQLMADGLGISTAKLIKMMEAGEVTSDALVPFANELDRRFGPGLAESLEGTATQLGRLKNAAFEALLVLGAGGFVDALGDLARTLTEVLQSADMQTFLTNISGALATLMNLLGFVAENFQLVTMAMFAFIGVKLIPFALTAVNAFGRMRVAMVTFQTDMRVTQTVMASTGAGMGRMAVAARGLSAALKGLLASTGIGLAVVVASSLFGAWITEADAATEAMSRHRDMIGQIKNAYDDTDGSVAAFRETVKSLDGISLTKLQTSLDELNRTFDEVIEKSKYDARSKDSFFTNFFGFQLGSWDIPKEYQNGIESLFSQFEKGSISAKELTDGVEELNQKFRNGEGDNADYAAAMDAAAAKLVETKEAVEDTSDAITALTGSTEESEAALNRLNDVVEETAESLQIAAEANFARAMEDLNGQMPDATKNMTELEKTVDGVAVALEKALEAAAQMPDAMKRIAAEGDALAAANAAIAAAGNNAGNNFGSYGSGLEAASSLIREKEGFRSTPYWDVNAYRAGYGSDTVTLADGSIQAITKGMRVSQEDAERDLARRLTQEFIPAARKAVGEGVFDALKPQQQAVLTSLAYNYGAGAFAPGKALSGVASKVASGASDADVAEAIRRLADATDRSSKLSDAEKRGLRTRRAEEAGIYQSAANDARSGESIAREQERAAEEARKLAEQSAERLADGEAEIRQQELINAGLEKQAEIEAAVAEARKENPNISDADIKIIEEQTARLYDLKNAKDANKEATEAAQKAEEQVNLILQQRQALEEQLKIAKESGNNELVNTLTGEIEGLNTQLIAAIENAKAMWAAVGGQESATAIAQLETAKIKAQNFSQSAEENIFSWKKVGELFMGGLNNAFSTFAQGIAEGKGLFESARDAFLAFASDFLIQIGQMIVKQILFNSIKGTSFGNFLGIGAAHSGGRVGSVRAGSGNMTRQVNPAVFAGAMRYHEGGVVGLRPGEVPIIAEEGEKVVTEAQQRQEAREKSKGGGGMRQKIVNAFDAPGFLEAALSTSAGEKLLLNFVQARASKINTALGSK